MEFYKAEQHHIELVQILKDEERHGRISYLPPRDNDRRLPVHVKQPPPNLMQRISREDTSNVRSWYSRRCLDDEIDEYESGVVINESIPSNGKPSHLLFIPRDNAEKNQQRSLCIMEIQRRKLPVPPGSPINRSVKEADLERIGSISPERGYFFYTTSSDGLGRTKEIFFCRHCCWWCPKCRRQFLHGPVHLGCK